MTTLESAAVKILEMAINYGKTYIITNAAEGWVEFSSSKFMPEVFKILHKVTVISARSRWEHAHPTDVG